MQTPPRDPGYIFVNAMPCHAMQRTALHCMNQASCDIDEEILLLHGLYQLHCILLSFNLFWLNAVQNGEWRGVGQWQWQCCWGILTR